MKLFKSVFIAFFIVTIISCKEKLKPNKPGLEVVYEMITDQLNQQQKTTITGIINKSEKKVRSLLPNLPKNIKVIIEVVDWNLNTVGGVTGRTETNNPAIVYIQISNKYNEGINNAINTGLASTIFHEFHHLSRGWAIQDNKFEKGIDIAMINEGLAEVFAEEYTNAIFEENHIPKNANPDEWIKEILGLSKYADYQKWMFEHPDGRTSIGYRSGNYLVRKIIKNSNKSILELSKLKPKEIIELAGY